MHFNTKYIFNSDSEGEIIKKINYNFDQIFSFGIGPEGINGPRGVRGYPGPAGYKGLTGSNGQRGSIWYSQSTQPILTPNPYDLWIDTSTSSYDVKSFGSTSGTWANTGYSLFSSTYFYPYSGIIGPGGATDKYSVGIKSGSGFIESETSLIINDKILDVSNSNPNRSKFLISTSDQITRPILTFSKTGSTSKAVPSFYWKDTGANTNLRFYSGGDFTIYSLTGLNFDSYTAKSLLYGNSANITSAKDFTLGGTGDFYFKSNVTSSLGSNYNITANNIRVSSTYFNSWDPITIVATTGNSALSSTKTTGTLKSSSGVEIHAASSVIKAFDFTDLNGSSIFSSKVLGPSSSGNHLQTIFGGTGQYSGGATGGPYFSHVKKLNLVTSGTTQEYIRYSNTSSYDDVYNIFDLSNVSNWNSDIIVVSPSSYVNPSYPIYIKIPTSPESTVNGLYYKGYGNNYRIILNQGGSATWRKIAGFVYNYKHFDYSGFGSNEDRTYFLNFDGSTSGVSSSQCYYFDIFFAPEFSQSYKNPIIFWKTCEGIGGSIRTTNKIPPI